MPTDKAGGNSGSSKGKGAKKASENGSSADSSAGSSGDGPVVVSGAEYDVKAHGDPLHYLLYSMFDAKPKATTAEDGSTTYALRFRPYSYLNFTIILILIR